MFFFIAKFLMLFILVMMIYTFIMYNRQKRHDEEIRKKETPHDSNNQGNQLDKTDEWSDF
ncbi:hypothetical protein [Vagococcus zengguangii]|uniref:Uncharacterized protein n=1 Tax=Vagococcus zengguangii TaxID=2571750 RepID=A0A4D7CWE9_9ENTE|nr:hypothetical protein [Vagococcus zengguangii]QCI86601.1 hypothetical protein FA707_06290 [Vagococcus zengguangii]TLG79763.1 hypothetical protein FE258_07830 [Vagococcus zengguangii]